MTDYFNERDARAGSADGARRWPRRLRGLGVMLLSVTALLIIPAAIDQSFLGERAELGMFDLPAHIESLIQHHALSYGLDPALLTAIIRVESNFNPLAVSQKGALGLMQLMPRTAMSLRVDDPMNPGQNIRGGAKQLRYLLDRFEDNLELALAAYHAGESRVSRYEGIPPFASTQHYVKKVLRTYRTLQRSAARDL